ncbi:MAG: 1,4-dihydroxy-6-naphthoate synthase [Planctomycetes bacterium]|nr:1,4-dihydroxy-6-naphthoate synthase [Planctomycetota bacterium]
MSAAVYSVGYSPCPNDVFIFEALISGLIPSGGLRFEPVIADVEALNRRALKGELDITKISCHAYGHLRDSYALLDSGAALGRGCGPLLIARRPLERRELREGAIAIPGALTTAALLLRLYEPAARKLEAMEFSRIIEAVASGVADAGVIIHESRFTYQRRGLVAVADLGEWWERETGRPIPLGGIIAHRRLGEAAIQRFDRLLRRSIEHARRHPEKIWPALRRHAQEMDDRVIQAHIDLYVTGYTDSLGEEGRKAVEELLRRAEEAGALPKRAKTPS